MECNNINSNIVLSYIIVFFYRQNKVGIEDQL